MEKTKVLYREFGAVGDGVTDDFHAIKAAHDYANEHNIPVYAESGKTYYIGDAPIKEREYITINTNVFWEGAHFIFDDAKIPVEHRFPKHILGGVEVDSEDFVKAEDNETSCERCLKKISKDPNGCTCKSGGWHTLPIFYVKSCFPEENLEALIGGKVMKGDEYITLQNGEIWRPGKTMLIKIFDASERHYIRFGRNENNGSDQLEILLIGADGRIDDSTKLHWSYKNISRAVGRCADDEPITILGGDDCIITTYANQGPNYYYMYGRNIKITRSNVTIDGIKHYIEREGIPGKGKCPTAFTDTSFSNNVTFKNMMFTHQRDHFDESNKTILGTYEIAANSSNKISWINCGQTNFFDPDGSTRYKGFFGTNYCKNFYIDGCTFESFDAHCSAYNVTIKNSTFEHINYIGEGYIHLENVVIYTDGARCIGHLRGDYGSTWTGEMFIKNVELRSSNLKGKDNALSIFNGVWHNHYFGYTTYLPEKITIDGFKISKYDFGIENGERWEKITATNSVPLHVYANMESFRDVDISDPNAKFENYPNDRKKCNCEVFNDTDGDGRCNNTINSTINVGSRVWCWGYKDEPDKTANANPYIAPKTIDIRNCGDLDVIIPPTPQFAKTKITINGKPAGIDPETGVAKVK